MRSGSRMLARFARPERDVVGVVREQRLRVEVALGRRGRDLLAAHRGEVAARGREDGGAAAGRDEIAGHAAERVAARDRLPVPELAARADRAAPLDGDVPDLGGEAVGAAVDPAVDDQAAADTGSERDHQRDACAGGRALGCARASAATFASLSTTTARPVARARSARNGASRTPGMFGA